MRALQNGVSKTAEDSHHQQGKGLAAVASDDSPCNSATAIASVGQIANGMILSSTPILGEALRRAAEQV